MPPPNAYGGLLRHELGGYEGGGTEENPYADIYRRLSEASIDPSQYLQPASAGLSFAVGIGKVGKNLGRQLGSRTPKSRSVPPAQPPPSKVKLYDFVEFTTETGKIGTGRVRDIDTATGRVWIFPADRSLITPANMLDEVSLQLPGENVRIRGFE